MPPVYSQAQGVYSPLMNKDEAISILRGKNTPRRAKIALIILIAYLLCPIDIIPDFIPVLGQLDDIVVAGILLNYIRIQLDKAQET